jgi:DNA repair ATPase RecN
MRQTRAPRTTQQAPSSPPPPTLQDVQKMLVDALKALGAAYQAVNTVDQKDHIFAAIKVLQEENDAVTRAILDQNTTVYAPLTKDFKNAANVLQEVKDQINTWIKYVDVATQVIEALAKLLPLLGVV